MPRPRKYTQAQRDAMYALWHQGLGATEIALRCQEGRAGVPPFDAKRRSVQDICRTMELEERASSPRQTTPRPSPEMLESLARAEAAAKQERPSRPASESVDLAEQTPAPAVSASAPSAHPTPAQGGGGLSATDRARARTLIAELERTLAEPKSEPARRQSGRPVQRPASAPLPPPGATLTLDRYPLYTRALRRDA